MYPVRLRASISEAKVFGSNWYVSILCVPSAPDFAKSAIDTETDKKAGDLDDWGFAMMKILQNQFLTRLAMIKLVV